MLLPTTLLIFSSLLPALGIPLAPLTKRTCDETVDRLCFGSGGTTLQNVDIMDIEYAAAYLRSLADSNANILWNMPPELDCSEWEIPIDYAGTVRILAKHTNPRTNSSVTYHDLARTIDGGINATPEQREASLLGVCGSAGGMKVVTADKDGAAYKSPAYVSSKAKPEDIVVKLVRSPFKCVRSENLGIREEPDVTRVFCR